MRKTKAFCPSYLDGLESRIALSTVAATGIVPAEVAKVTDHHDHTPRAEDLTAHEGEHHEHKDHATK